MELNNMIFRPPKVKEETHLWITITMVILLSVYTVMVQFTEPLQNFFEVYTEFQVVRTVNIVLFFWLLAVMWIAYRKWCYAVDRRRELQTVVASISPDALLVVSPDCKIQMCNTSVKKLFGYEPEDIVNNSTDILYYDRRSEDEKDEVSRCLKKFGFHVGYATGKTKDGKTFPLELITGDLAGQPGAVILARDITERQQAEEALRISHEKQQKAIEELKQTQEQIIHHERLRVLGQMASYIAHEFNNALTPIMGFTEFMLSDFDNLKGKDDMKKYLQDINTAAKDASSVVRRLREFYKVKGTKEQDSLIDLNKTIEDAISLTRPKWKDEALAAGKDVEFDTKFGNIPAVPGSEEEMHEVLTNLIFNAVDAIPEHSSGKINISTENLDGKVSLTFTDNGKGMTEEIKQQCFEPFYSTNKVDGSGLGLVVVANVVERHNGHVECTSSQNKGTTFEITLPTSQGQVMKEKKVHGSVTQCLKILVADDELLIRKLVTQFLETEGHTVVAVPSGKQALSKVKEDTFDLVITDWAMPEMNGDELVKSIRREISEIPIILMTGFAASPHFDFDSSDLEVDAVIEKPITQHSLLNAVYQTIEEEAADNVE